MAANCVRDPVVLTPVRDVYDAYQAWAVSEHEDTISPMRLTQELKRRGVETSRTKTTRMYRGIAVTALAELPIATA
jgi:phage/plasmid-associated DNA primase